MNKFLSLIILLALTTNIEIASAGNPDRAGQAGAQELLINPWSRSSGWNGVNYAEVSGVEAMNLNPSGILLLGNNSTEFLFSRTTWLSGTDIFINAFGFCQKVGKEGQSALGVAVTSFDFGKIDITTEDNPEGGLGTFSPQFTNIAIAYSHKFSNKIRTGFDFRLVSESIPNANAFGASIDAGIQYFTDVTGHDQDRSKLSVTLRNIGTPMQFGGDGLTRRSSIQGSPISMSMDTKSASFELPTLLNVAISEDFYLDSRQYQKLTAAASFTSNSFSNDQYTVGLQYSLKNILMLRGGMFFEKDLFNSDSRLNIYTGPSAGFTVNIPINKDKTKFFAVDYSFRATQYFNGTHCIGARIIL